jgi:hypothetical protein
VRARQAGRQVPRAAPHPAGLTPHRRASPAPLLPPHPPTPTPSYGIRGLIIDPYNELDHRRSSHVTETEFVSQMLTKV